MDNQHSTTARPKPSNRPVRVGPAKTETERRLRCELFALVTRHGLAVDAGAVARAAIQLTRTGRRDEYPVPEITARTDAGEVRLVETFLWAVQYLARGRDVAVVRAGLARQIEHLEEREYMPVILWRSGSPSGAENAAIAVAAHAVYGDDVWVTHYVWGAGDTVTRYALPRREGQ